MSGLCGRCCEPNIQIDGLPLYIGTARSFKGGEFGWGQLGRRSVSAKQKHSGDTSSRHKCKVSTNPALIAPTARAVAQSKGATGKPMRSIRWRLSKRRRSWFVGCHAGMICQLRTPCPASPAARWSRDWKSASATCAAGRRRLHPLYPHRLRTVARRCGCLPARSHRVGLGCPSPPPLLQCKEVLRNTQSGCEQSSNGMPNRPHGRLDKACAGGVKGVGRGSYRLLAGFGVVVLP